MYVGLDISWDLNLLVLILYVKSKILSWPGGGPADMVGGARIENIAEGQLSSSWTMAKKFEIDRVECIKFFSF